MHAAIGISTASSKVRRLVAELYGVTILARSNLPAPPCAEIRLAREPCSESRIIALRAAIAEGRYRIDAEAIAARLVATLDSRTESLCQHH